MFERRDFKTRCLSTGDNLSIPVFYFKGSDKNAPSVYIQSSVHGAELQGYMVSLLLIQHFSQYPPKGDVTLLPIANPYGMNNKMGEYTLGRFDPMTGDNWNRHYENLCCLTLEDKEYENQIVAEHFVNLHKNASFTDLISMFKQSMQSSLQKKLAEPQSYSKKLNLQLQLLASQADIVLDLHCDSLSKPHVYCPSYALDSALMLNIPYLIEIPHKFKGALDEATFSPWIHLVNAYNAHKSSSKISKPIFESFTLELGNQEQINAEEAKEQSDNILYYLSQKGVCYFKNIERISVISTKLENFITLYSPIGGLIIDSARLGNVVKTNSPLIVMSNLMRLGEITSDENLIEKTSFPISYSENCIPITRINSANVHEGTAVMKIMTRVRNINREENLK